MQKEPGCQIVPAANIFLMVGKKECSNAVETVAEAFDNVCVKQYALLLQLIGWGRQKIAGHKNGNKMREAAKFSSQEPGFHTIITI